MTSSTKRSTNCNTKIDTYEYDVAYVLYVAQHIALGEIEEVQMWGNKKARRYRRYRQSRIDHMQNTINNIKSKAPRLLS